MHAFGCCRGTTSYMHPMLAVAPSEWASQSDVWAVAKTMHDMLGGTNNISLLKHNTVRSLSSRATMHATRT